jgi:hypothetical protein
MVELFTAIGFADGRRSGQTPVLPVTRQQLPTPAALNELIRQDEQARTPRTGFSLSICIAALEWSTLQFQSLLYKTSRNHPLCMLPRTRDNTNTRQTRLVLPTRPTHSEMKKVGMSASPTFASPHLRQSKPTPELRKTEERTRQIPLDRTPGLRRCVSLLPHNGSG